MDCLGGHAAVCKFGACKATLRAQLGFVLLEAGAAEVEVLRWQHTTDAWKCLMRMRPARDGKVNVCPRVFYGSSFGSQRH